MTYTVRLRGGGRIRTDGTLTYRHDMSDTIEGITLQDEGKRMYIPIVCIKEIIEDGDTVWRTNR